MMNIHKVKEIIIFFSEVWT